VSRIPHPAEHSSFLGSGCGHVLAVGRKSDVTHSPGQCIHSLDDLARREIPQDDLLTAGKDVLAIGGERHSANGVTPLSFPQNKLFPVLDSPEPYRAIHAPGNDVPPARREANRSDSPVVNAMLPADLAFGDVPDHDVPVPIAGDRRGPIPIDCPARDWRTMSLQAADPFL